MFRYGRKGRFAWLLAGAVAIGLLGGCGTTDEPEAEPEAKKVVTDAQLQTVRQMDEAAEQAYQATERGDLEDAKSRFAQLSVLSTKLTYEGLATVEGMQAVAESVTGAMQALNAAKPDATEVSMRVAAARLAVDALANREQPMWLGFQSSLLDDLTRMESAVASRNDPEASRALKMWKGHVSVVRPAVVVSRNATEAVKLDSITAFLENGVRAADWNGMKQAMPNLKNAVSDVFAEEDRETVSPLLPTAEPPHPILWSLVLGAFIVGVLAYVAWRKYEALQGVSRVKRERDFDQ